MYLYCEKDKRLGTNKNTLSINICKHPLHLIKGCLDMGMEGIVKMTHILKQM